MVLRTGGIENHRTNKTFRFLQIRKQRGEYAEALTVYEEALEIQLKSLGNSHPAVAVTISNIGLINYQTRNYTKALDHYQEALRIRRDAFGENNLEVASCKSISWLYN